MSSAAGGGDTKHPGEDVLLQHLRKCIALLPVVNGSCVAGSCGAMLYLMMPASRCTKHAY